MSWYTLNLFAFCSLVRSKSLSISSFVQANRILHGVVRGVSPGFGVIRACVKEDPNKKHLLSNSICYNTNKYCILLAPDTYDLYILHLYNGKHHANKQSYLPKGKPASIPLRKSTPSHAVRQREPRTNKKEAMAHSREGITCNPITPCALIMHQFCL
jgi:hypothetical protein